MAGLRLPELLLILSIVILLFGVTKLPQLGDALGKGIRSFRRATERGLDDEERELPPPSPRSNASAR